MEFSNEEAESNCFMENPEDDELTFHFSYNDLFRKCKKLNKESCNLKHFVSTSKTTISSTEIENKNLLEEKS